MSFSGKKYRRVACENIEELFKTTDSKQCLLWLLKSNAPIFSYQKLDEDTFRFTMQIEDKSYMHTFKLGVEHEMEKLDGSKLKMIYTLENENILTQVIRRPGGREVHFIREFRENEAELTITIPGIDMKAKVMYEVVP